MSDIMKIGVALLLAFILLLLSPIIFFGILGVIGRVEYTIQKTTEDRATEKAKSSIEQFKVNDNKYDISTVIFGISNSEIEFEYDGEKFIVEGFEYNMGTSAFNDKCTYWLHSYNKDGNDIQLINDICKVLNKYDLEYEFVDTYIYRGSGYGDGYIFGEYDTGYLNGQYLEITLRPIEGEYTVLRFDLDLVSGSVESDIIKDLRGIETINEAELPWSIGTLLGLINIDE